MTSINIKTEGFTTAVLYTVAITAMLFLLMMFLIKPAKHRNKAREFTRYKYAHRGLFNNNNGIPENSLAAFTAAKEHGYGVELDVQLTSDGQAVVFHDEDLKRMCGVDNKIRTLSYEELSSYKLLNTDQRIPLFTEVLALLGDTPVICELKDYPFNCHSTLCDTTAEIISKASGKICMESFNPLAVRYFRKKYPSIIRGQLSMDYFKVQTGLFFLTAFALKHLLFNALSRPHFIAYRHTDKRCFSFRLCNRLFKPCSIAWTVITEEEEKKACAAFDTVIFEGYLSKKEILG